MINTHPLIIVAANIGIEEVGHCLLVTREKGRIRRLTRGMHLDCSGLFKSEDEQDHVSVKS
jgi:hypothetical protein